MNDQIKVAIEKLLKKKIGLNASTLGSSAVIEKAVSDRMNACQIFDLPTYLIYLQSSPQEWEALIEKVIVPETWFFRDQEAFNFLRKYIVSEWRSNQSLQKLRILSLPCSTGEEPYSISMTLLDAGLTPSQFQIDAVDISKLSLQKAKRGIYGKNSFRGQSFASASSQGFKFLDHYFEPINNSVTYQISREVKQTVNLTLGNLMDPWFIKKSSDPYQIIFCRNLLIYFDNDCREKAMQVMNRLLTPEGLLFVGSAETGALMGKNFTSVHHPMSFAYRKTEIQKTQRLDLFRSQSSRQNLSSNSFIQPKPDGSKPKIKFSQKNQQKSLNIDAVTVANPSQSNSEENVANDVLKNARTLANQGKLPEAVNLCQTYLAKNPMSVPAYVLLGEVHQALGNDREAEQCFQRAVYLDPNHYEALMHLALLQEQQGNIGNAALIRQRIQRLDRQ
jgi:chemotaxis protein methyltransferase WspC